MGSGRDAKAMILTTQLQVLIKGSLQLTSRGDRWKVTAKKRERRQTLWANCVAVGLAHGDQAFREPPGHLLTRSSAPPSCS